MRRCWAQCNELDVRRVVLLVSGEGLEGFVGMTESARRLWGFNNGESWGRCGVEVRHARGNLPMDCPRSRAEDSISPTRSGVRCISVNMKMFVL